MVSGTDEGNPPSGVPSDARFVRTTATFDSTSVPRGLLRDHRIAAHTWGVLRVADGSVRFVLDGAAAVALTSGDHVVIEPGVTHHVEPAADARFAIDFYATKDDEA